MGTYIPPPSGGSGDMTKAVYDSDANGVIVKAQLDASLANTSGTNTGDQTLAGLGGIAHSLATAINDFLVASGAGVFVKKTLAEVKTILDWATDIATHAGLTTGVHGAGVSTLETVAGSQAKVDARLSSANATDLTDGGATTLHSHAGGGGLNLLKTTANQTINAGAATFVDITGLTFSVTSGVDYAFHFYITFRSAATTTGWKSGVNHPGGVLDFWAKSDIIANGAAGVATHTERHNVGVDDMTLLTATVTAGVDLSIIIEGRYQCSVSGTFAARFANELASNTNLIVQKGSWGWWF